MKGVKPLGEGQQFYRPYNIGEGRHDWRKEREKNSTPRGWEGHGPGPTTLGLLLLEEGQVYCENSTSKTQRPVPAQGWGWIRTTDNPIPALPHPPGNNQQCLPLVLGGWRESGETPLWCRHTGKLRLEKAHWEKSFLAHGDANQWNKQTCTTLSTILT